MAISQKLILCSFFILSLALPYVFAIDYNHTRPAEKKFEVVVEGLVYCQSCNNHGTWSLNKAKPIASAKVSVICKNYKSQVTFYKVYETNAYGYFFAQLTGYKMNNCILDHPLQACKVKLVSSPLESCNLLTNINYGLYGASLRYENKILVEKDYKAVLYSAGPLAFRPDDCLPTTHD